MLDWRTRSIGYPAGGAEVVTVAEVDVGFGVVGVAVVAHHVAELPQVDGHVGVEPLRDAVDLQQEVVEGVASRVEDAP